MILRLLATVAALTGLLFHAGCATASTSTGMAASPAPAAPTAPRHAGGVTITVNGGRETKASGASQIANADFAAAIRASIEQSRLFERVGTEASDYAVEVYIGQLRQPTMGFDMTVEMETNWTLRRTRDQAVLWQQAVLSKHTATMGDTMVGVKRLRLANEGAARANIETALKAIAALDLAPST